MAIDMALMKNTHMTARGNYKFKTWQKGVVDLKNFYESIDKSC